MKKIIELPWPMVALLCLTIGLAPFTPPHIYEKLVMLSSGELSQMIDWFDLLMHGSPWILLLIKLAATVKRLSKHQP